MNGWNREGRSDDVEKDSDRIVAARAGKGGLLFAEGEVDWFMLNEACRPGDHGVELDVAVVVDGGGVPGAPATGRGDELIWRAVRSYPAPGWMRN